MAKEKIESFNEFKIVGRIQPIDDGHRVYKSAKYEVHNLKFRVLSENNSFHLECVGFKPTNPREKIKYFTRNNDMCEVAFTDRMEVDTSKLSFSHKSIKSADISNDGIHFVTDYDFIQYMCGLLEKGHFEDKIYFIRGNIEYQSFPDKNTNEIIEREMFVPKRLVAVEDSTEEYAQAKIRMYIGEDCLVKVGEKAHLTGKSVVRSRNVKGKFEGYDTTITFPLSPENSDTQYEFLKKTYKASNERLGKVGIIVKLISGAEEVEFTEEHLSEHQRSSIAFGFDTFEEIKEKMGKGKGDWVREKVRIGDMPEYDGVVDSTLSLSELELTLRENKVDITDVLGDNTDNAENKTKKKNKLDISDVLGTSDDGKDEEKPNAYTMLSDDDLPFK